NRNNAVPPKVRELIAQLESAGFVDRGGKGSHRNYVHPRIARPVTEFGKPGDDGKRYQVRAVQLAIEESMKKKCSTSSVRSSKRQSRFTIKKADPCLDQPPDGILQPKCRASRDDHRR